MFVYARKDGTIQEYIEGPCDLILDTANLPILASIVGVEYIGGTPFQAEVYYVAVNGQSTGPFDMAILKQMAANGQLTADSLVWRNGMTQWEKAGMIDELNGVFINMPPIPSNE